MSLLTNRYDGGLYAVPYKMTLGNYNLNHIWLKISQYQNQINTVIVAGLSLYLIAFAAQITWSIVPSKTSETQPVNAIDNRSSNRSSSSSVDIAKIQQLSLFGKADESISPVVEEVIVEDAPETNLNLTLTGAVTSSEKDGGAAIIDNRGTQNTYGIGEKIDGTNATVNKVLNDRIIIKNGSRLETLMLDGFDFSEQKTQTVQTNRSRSTNTASTPNKPKPKPISRENVNQIKQLRNDSKSFTTFISIAPVRENGQMLGFRVSPGRDPQLFKQTGLKNNDIITQINGLDVTDVRQSVEAMQVLRASEILDLTVNRDDTPITLSIDLTSHLEEIED